MTHDCPPKIRVAQTPLHASRGQRLARDLRRYSGIGAAAIRYARDVTTLLDSHGGRLHALLYRLTLRADVADDLLQDLALRLAGAGAFAAAASPYAFARTTATRLAMDWHRRQRLRRAETAAVDLDLLAHENAADPAASLAHREQWEGLLAHLAALDERDQTLLTMRYLDGCDFEQIAAETNSTPHRVRGLLHKALGRLRQRVGVNRGNDPRRKSEVTHD
jgi:RNA polymerase sigma factor (sigma-70 family)